MRSSHVPRCLALAVACLSLQMPFVARARAEISGLAEPTIAAGAGTLAWQRIGLVGDEIEASAVLVNDSPYRASLLVVLLASPDDELRADESLVDFDMFLDLAPGEARQVALHSGHPGSAGSADLYATLRVLEIADPVHAYDLKEFARARAATPVAAVANATIAPPVGPIIAAILAAAKARAEAIRAIAEKWLAEQLAARFQAEGDEPQVVPLESSEPEDQIEEATADLIELRIEQARADDDPHALAEANALVAHEPGIVALAQAILALTDCRDDDDC